MSTMCCFPLGAAPPHGVLNVPVNGAIACKRLPFDGRAAVPRETPVSAFPWPFDGCRPAFSCERELGSPFPLHTVQSIQFNYIERWLGRFAKIAHGCRLPCHLSTRTS